MKLFGPDLLGCLVAVSLDDPGGVVGFPEVEERQPQLLHGVEGADPEQVFLQGADEAFGAAVTSGARTKAGELSMPKKVISVWKTSAMYWLT